MPDLPAVTVTGLQVGDSVAIGGSITLTCTAPGAYLPTGDRSAQHSCVIGPEWEPAVQDCTSKSRTNVPFMQSDNSCDSSTFRISTTCNTNLQPDPGESQILSLNGLALVFQARRLRVRRCPRRGVCGAAGAASPPPNAPSTSAASPRPPPPPHRAVSSRPVRGGVGGARWGKEPTLFR